MDTSRTFNNSKIVLNCSANFSSLRIEDPKKGAADDESNNVPKYLINAIPDLTKYFNLHEKIGEGTFSKVYRAKLVKDDSGQEYALKCVVPTIKLDRVAAELRYLRDLGGDSNIIGIKACLYGQGFSVIVMPYFQHDHFMDVVKVMNAAEIRDYMKNLFIALAKVHKHGIIHRDIKPSNFLYNRARRLYGLVDFGLAQTEKSMVSYAKLVQSQCKDKMTSHARVPLRESKIFNSYDANKNAILVKKRNFEEVETNLAKAYHSKRLKISSSYTNAFNIQNAPLDLEKESTNDHDYGNIHLFGTPTRRTSKENFMSPVKGSPKKHFIPDTPPRQSLGNKSDAIRIKIATDQNKTEKLINQSEVRISHMNSVQQNLTSSHKDKKQNAHLVSSGSYSSHSCGCFAKGRVCRSCAKRTELVAPRAGTPGFRAPEVLLRHLHQTTAIDIWSAGVILASLLSRRYPFFRNIDDLTSLAEIITLLGTKRVQKAAKELNRTLALSVKQLPPLDLKSVCERLRCSDSLAIEDSAYDLLNRLLEPNPAKRLTAEEALRHPFIANGAK